MNISFDPEIFYSRQIRMKEIGQLGQSKLRDSRVVIFGLGGLGTFESLLLTLAGVGEIGLVDDDIVGMENLHRAPLYSLRDIGRPKVEVAKEKLEAMNPDVKVLSFRGRISEELLDRVLPGANCMMDGLDNFDARRKLNRQSIKMCIPYIYAGVQAFEGNVSTFMPPETACLECILPSVSCDLLDFLPECRAIGVIGASASTIASIASTDCIKLLLGLRPTLKGKLLTIDLKNLDFRFIDLKRNPECPTCGRM